MKTTCIKHPNNEAIVIIRKWQLEMFDGNRVAAALCSFFEYWHNWKLAEQKQRTSRAKAVNDDAETDLLQYHTTEDLVNGIMNVAGRNKVIEARNLLIELGVLSRHKNPNPKFSFDRTIYYKFHPEVCSNYITTRSLKLNDGCIKKGKSFILNSNNDNPEKVNESFKSNRTITEYTSEITTKTTSEKEKEKKDFVFSPIDEENEELEILLANEPNTPTFQFEQKKELFRSAKIVLEYFKELTGVNYPIFRDNSKIKSTHIKAIEKNILEKGFSIDDAKLAIQYKWLEWKDSSYMRGKIRPSTIAGRKFEEYLDNAKLAKNDPKAQEAFKDSIQDNQPSGRDQSIIDEAIRNLENW